MLRLLFLLSMLPFLRLPGVTAQESNAITVEYDDKLGKVIFHRVSAYDTPYSLARIYGTTKETLRKLNPGMDSRQMPKLIKVPLAEERMVYRLPLFRNKRDYIPVIYKAKPKDNLFRISRIYFDMSTAMLKNRNRIRENNLSRGQILKIGWIKMPEDDLLVLSGERVEETPGINEVDQRYKTQFLDGLKGDTPPSKNEVAFWKKDAPASGFFVMHRKASERSYIEITNPLSSSRIYAKVIGKIPENLYPEEVDMVMSSELAEALGAKDVKFFVRSRYANK